jgi:hypothetical protein
MIRLAVFCLLAAPALAASEESRIPFWPDAVPEAIQARVDGVAALETVRELGRFHRVHGSPGFRAAAEHVRAKAQAAGLAEAAIERFEADGKTRYAHFRSYLGWNPVAATLEEVSPRPRVLARFPDLPTALADYSQDADVTAELVDVGAGAKAQDYAGREVAGRIVIASGPLPDVHRLAVEERRAVGFLSDFPNQTTAWSGDDRDLVRWGHLSPYQEKNTFAFMLSKRQSEDLRRRLAGGENVVLRARVQARMVPATYDVVSAVLPGSDSTAGEVLLTAHLCHQSAGANDNASGSAAILEVARALRSAIAAGTLPPPRRTVRVLWAPEIAGSEAWAVRHPELVKRTVAGIHMDMVGGRLDAIHGTFHLSRTAASLPHAVNAVAQAWFDDLVRASSAFAERGGDPRRGLVWAPGTREAFLGDVRDLELGSDHEVFQEASFGVPMVYFHDWPDVTIHTNKDQPENLDPTKLGRVAYLGAGIAWTLAALPDDKAKGLLATVRAEAEARMARAGLRASMAAEAWDGVLARREAVAVGARSLRSVGDLHPAAAASARAAADALERTLAKTAPPAGRDTRVPARSPDVRGPVDVYYYDHLRETLGPDASLATALTRRESGGVLGYEALNFVDGQRTVAEIRDVLAGRYEAVPVSEVAEYLDLLAKADVIRWSIR